jgi:O-antigen/teichoic acid export membrane protein
MVETQDENANRQQKELAQADYQNAGKHRLLYSTFSNIVGALIPLVLQLATIPLYLKTIGPERYGVLTLVWLILGYFGLFDLGFGRAIASRIAMMHDDTPDARARVFWTGTSLSLLTGTIGGLCLFLVGHFLFADVLNLSAELSSESQDALPWIAATLPVVTGISALSGALQGRQAFVPMNVGQTTGMIFYQIMPLAVAVYVSTAIPWLVAAAIAGRLVTAGMLLASCLREIPSPLRPRFARSEIRNMLAYGGWATVSGVISPILTVFDRLVIGATSGMGAVATYSVPFNIVIRLGLFPTSVQSALFPRYAMKSEDESRHLLLRSVRLQAWMMTPIVLFGILMIRPFLQAWVGAGFAASTKQVGEILLLGLWFNALALVPYSSLQSRGRPDVPAKAHILELIVYLPALWIGVSFWGINGAAWAWDFRVIMDAIILFSCVRSLKDSRVAGIGLAWVISAFLWASFGPTGLLQYYAGVGVLCFGCAIWVLQTMPPDIANLLARKRFKVA